MQKHTKIYFDGMKYDPDFDYIPCEFPTCNRRCNDVHHIRARGMGGSKHRDFIENLMGLCTGCHLKYGDVVEWRLYLLQRHIYMIELRGGVWTMGNALIVHPGFTGPEASPILP